jgi:hypothetical protein
MAYGYSAFGHEDVWTGKVKVSGLRELKSELVPTTITFMSLADPSSAKVIHATGHRQECQDKTQKMPNCAPDDVPIPIDNIAETLGPGYAFRRATLEVVPNTTSVTRGIEAKLPWWNGPFPWQKPLSPGSSTYVDTRPADQFRWNKEHFKRGF